MSDIVERPKITLTGRWSEETVAPVRTLKPGSVSLAPPPNEEPVPRGKRLQTIAQERFAGDAKARGKKKS